MKIVVDTREKKPYTFSQDVEKSALNVGDYSVAGLENTVAVERKTLNDLASSLGAHRKRFEREVERAQLLEEFYVVIEAWRSEVENYADTGECPNYYSNIYPNSVLGTVDKWPLKYDTLEFIWAGNRENAKEKTLTKLQSAMLTYSTE